MLQIQADGRTKESSSCSDYSDGSGPSRLPKTSSQNISCMRWERSSWWSSVFLSLSINNRNDFQKDRLAEKAPPRKSGQRSGEGSAGTQYDHGSTIWDIWPSSIQYYITSLLMRYMSLVILCDMISFPFFGTFRDLQRNICGDTVIRKAVPRPEWFLKSEISDYYEVYYNYLGRIRSSYRWWRISHGCVQWTASGTYEYALIACGAQTTFPHIDVAAISADPGSQNTHPEIQHHAGAERRVGPILAWTKYFIEAIRNELDDRFWAAGGNRDPFCILATFASFVSLRLDSKHKGTMKTRSSRRTAGIRSLLLTVFDSSSWWLSGHISHSL